MRASTKNTKSAHKTKLNANQIRLLKLIYKFRYITPTLLAEHRNVLRWSINSSLATLLDKELVGRRYNKSYKLQGKAANYFLTTTGLKLLIAKHGINPVVLQGRYRDGRLSDGFIEHHLNVFRAYLQLKSQYADRFQLLTKYELQNSKHPFAELAPNLFLKPKGKTGKAYFLDIFEDKPYFVIKNRIQVYIDLYDDSNVSKNKYPTVLLVCPNSRVESKVQAHLDTLIEDVSFSTTTLSALLALAQTDGKIWSNTIDSDSLIALDDMMAS